MWYAPRWTHPTTGEFLPQHSLGTFDKQEAETAWVLEQAKLLRPAMAAAGALDRPVGPAQLTFGLRETFADAVAAYVAFKTRWSEDTRARWAAEIPTILGRDFPHPSGARRVTLGALRVIEFAGDMGTQLLAAWQASEVARHGGRTHTTVKRTANLVKPVLLHAHRKGWMGGALFPIFPELESDYEAAGARDIALTRAQFVVLASELAAHDAIRCYQGTRPPIGVYPRLAAVLFASTGMHRRNVDRFTTADWDEQGGRWFRVNSKNARHYPPEWFPCPPMLTAALMNQKARFEPHYCARWDGWDRRRVTPWAPPRCKACGRAADVWVRDPGPGTLPNDWMRMRLEYASKRARLPFVVATLDFRHTFATWKCEEGWHKDEVAKWLANSTGMVDRIYAQLANARFERHVENAALLEREMLEMVALANLGPRKGPRIVRTQFLPAASKLHSKGGSQ